MKTGQTSLSIVNKEFIKTNTKNIFQLQFHHFQRSFGISAGPTADLCTGNRKWLILEIKGKMRILRHNRVFTPKKTFHSKIQKSVLCPTLKVSKVSPSEMSCTLDANCGLKQGGKIIAQMGVIFTELGQFQAKSLLKRHMNQKKWQPISPLFHGSYLMLRLSKF